MDETAVLDRLRRLEIETPSWGYGNSGTRFHVYPWPGAARDVQERIADAALVHRLTGCCPSVALHIPWDAVDDYGELRRYAEEQGVRIGAINPNLFGDDAYRLGSLCSPDAGVRAQALAHCRECVEIAQATGSTIVSLWLADGTNYPGQGDIRARQDWLAEGLSEGLGGLVTQRLAAKPARRAGCRLTVRKTAAGQQSRHAPGPAGARDLTEEKEHDDQRLAPARARRAPR